MAANQALGLHITVVERDQRHGSPARTGRGPSSFGAGEAEGVEKAVELFLAEQVVFEADLAHGLALAVRPLGEGRRGIVAQVGYEGRDQGGAGIDRAGPGGGVDFRNRARYMYLMI